MRRKALQQDVAQQRDEEESLRLNDEQAFLLQQRLADLPSIPANIPFEVSIWPDIGEIQV